MKNKFILYIDFLYDEDFGSDVIELHFVIVKTRDSISFEHNGDTVECYGIERKYMRSLHYEKKKIKN